VRFAVSDSRPRVSDLWHRKPVSHLAQCDRAAVARGRRTMQANSNRAIPETALNGFR